MKIHKKNTQQVFQDKANSPKGSSPAQMAPVHKMDAKGDEELQMKRNPVQMMESPEVEEEEVQMKKGPVQMMESGEQEEE
ncbi:hypothetical protein, partial [Sporocytophaga myxococcoides]|uniref:hypothetical protein n=1 Tax=Sporocytophaga myxococcoides TaxID=153721 RepID=UPI00048BE5A4